MGAMNPGVAAISRPQADFYTAGLFAQEQARTDGSPRGRLVIASCQSGAPMARLVVDRYRALLAESSGYDNLQYVEAVDFQFSDTETCARLDADVSGSDVFLFQALRNPRTARTVDQNYMAFLIAARAAREWGANHVTGVLPYLAYARQDKPTRFRREPTTVELMADLSVKAGISRLVTWDPHTNAIHGLYGSVPVDALDALPLSVSEFRRFEGRDDVIAVAPDAGMAKSVTYFARALNVDAAVASKFRPRPEEAAITEIIGDFAGKRIALVLDDMIASGGTAYALVRELVDNKGIQQVIMAVSHNLCLPDAHKRLWELHHRYGLSALLVTNTVPQGETFCDMPFLIVRDLSETLARVVNRVHFNRSVGELVGPPLGVEAGQEGS